METNGNFGHDRDKSVSINAFILPGYLLTVEHDDAVFHAYLNLCVLIKNKSIKLIAWYNMYCSFYRRMMPIVYRY